MGRFLEKIPVKGIDNDLNVNYDRARYCPDFFLFVRSGNGYSKAYIDL